MPTPGDVRVLEAQSEDLRRQLASVGDLRPGSLVCT